MGIVYKATNKINGHSYIGQTIKSLVERKYIHKYDMKRSNYVFYRALRKYGWNNFNWEVIEEVPNEELNEKETYYIKKFDTFKNGYNMTMGGDNNPMTIPGIVEKMIKTKTGSKLTEEHKQNIGKSIQGKKNGFYGKCHTEETKKKMSEKAKIKTKKQIESVKKSNSKKWLLENIKTGTIIIIENLSQFCKEKKLHYGSMKSSFRMYGKYKNWRIENVN